MDVSAGDVVGQQGGLGFEDRFPQAVPVAVSVLGEPEQELPVVATMGEVVDMSRHDIAVGPWHERDLPEDAPPKIAQKTGPKSEP